MTTLYTWGAKWGVSLEALHDLQTQMGMHAQGTVVTGDSEAAVQNNVRLAYARAGVPLWRNNVGALQDPTGRWVRYGLCNDSKAVNEKVKSGDLIGIKPVVITPQMVGHRIGQFVSRECKAPGWSYKATEREQAQLAWAELILSLGGDAGFTSGV